MRIPGHPVDWRTLPGAVPAGVARVTPRQWTEGARLVHEGGGRLVALWGTDHREYNGAFTIYVAYAVREGLAVQELPVRGDRPAYPEIAGLFPAANRMQRALYDLLGVAAEGAADKRPWIRHGAWPADAFPLRNDFVIPEGPVAAEPYPFVRVEGDGVHEIPVGPIHAGVIEPGQFRFSVVGEKVLRLEERLAFTHKGIDKRVASFSVADGYKLAGRVSGDSTVAFAWAYAQAAESLLAVVPPPRARWLRALALERERVANHLGDLGALGNDAAFGFAFAQFMRLKEDWLRLNRDAFGRRLLMDLIVPGGVDADVSAKNAERFLRQVESVEREVTALQHIYEDHAGLQDRFLSTGRVTAVLARSLGLCGLAGRSSGQAYDLRADFPAPPYDVLEPKKIVRAAGDVAARVQARFDEVHESMRLLRSILLQMPEGERRVEIPEPRPGAFGVGWVEGWRGEAFVAIEAGGEGRIRHAHAHDPSWQNWPLLEPAVIGNIVPDFPLINKSFNLSYSGHDS
jgi:Ni,Fe-hydrogenase III large subunit/Ni,Fe-hydrogenase III component G